jgi:hypothetical protein
MSLAQSPAMQGAAGGILVAAPAIVAVEAAPAIAPTAANVYEAATTAAQNAALTYQTNEIVAAGVGAAASLVLKETDIDLPPTFSLGSDAADVASGFMSSLLYYAGESSSQDTSVQPPLKVEPKK